MNFIKNRLVFQETNNNQIPQPLCTQGFSCVEADNLEYIVSRKNTGRIFGFGCAAPWIAYHLRNYIHLPRAARNPVKLAGYLAVSPFFIYFWEIMFNHKRKGSNTKLANMYSNTILSINKRNLVQEFYSFNRKFTPEEIDQFIFTEQLRTRGTKNYTYNEYVHGDEETHKKRHFAWNNARRFLYGNIKE